MFMDLSSYQSLIRVIENVPIVKSELKAALGKDLGAKEFLHGEKVMDFPSNEWAWDSAINIENVGYDLRDGNYSIFTLFKLGHDLENIDEHFKETLSLLRGVEGLQYAAFSALGPGAHLKEHVHSRRHFICHVLLSDLGSGKCEMICNREIRDLKEPGDAAVFDYSLPHETTNFSSKTRVNLMIDFKP